MTTLQLFIAAAAVVSLVTWLISLTKRRDDYGLNLKMVRCAKCGQPLPRVRQPASWRQAMYGGSTCRNCGTEVDKWGREVGTEAEDQAGG